MKDIYVYPNTSILINKLDIKDAKKLDEKENNIVALNISSILINPTKIKTVFDIKTIHKKLFSDLYDWAGESRKINMYKEEPVLAGLSVNYSDDKNIDNDLKRLDTTFKNVEWKKINKEEKIDAIVHLISKLWRIHTFREGNSRTVTVFLYLFMKQIKMDVNINFIGKHAKFFRNALVLASIDQYSEYEHLTNILTDSISVESSSSKDYKTIKEYDVEEYEYRNHKYKD